MSQTVITKAEFTKKLNRKLFGKNARQLPITKQLIDAMFEEVKFQVLHEHKSINVKSFFLFAMKHRKARVLHDSLGVNRGCNDLVDVKARNVLFFSLKKRRLINFKAADKRLKGL